MSELPLNIDFEIKAFRDVIALSRALLRVELVRQSILILATWTRPLSETFTQQLGNLGWNHEWFRR